MAHLSLRQRKQMLARVTLWRAFDETLGFLGPSESTLLNLVRAQADRVLEQCSAELDDNAVPFDAFMASWADRLAATLTPLDAPGARPELSDFLTAVRQAAHGVSCSTCAAAEGHLCDGRESDDDRAVSRPGDCFRQLRTLFDAACQIAAGIYGPVFSNWTRPPSPMTFELGTRVSPGMPHGIALEPAVFVSGETIFAAGGPTRIQLVVPVHLVDAYSLWAVLYVCLHEVLVHGYQRVFCADRETDSHLDPFAEGWMDYAALVSLRRFASSAAGQVAAGMQGSRLHEVGQTFALARARCSGCQAGSARLGHAHAVQLGHEAARRLVSLLHRLPESTADPEAAFLELSGALNAAALPLDQRITLTSHVRRSLPPGDHIGSPVQAVSLVPQIRKALRDKNITSMVQLA